MSETGFHDADTIVAEATPPGRGGLAVVRISGPRAHAVAGAVFRPSGRSGRSGREAPMRSCRHGHVGLSDGVSDEATCTLFRRPASYTGEDSAELGVHGNPWVVAAVVAAAMEAGARPARPGEFTYRAWLNGRMGLSRAEAVDALVRAVCPLVAAEAARQAGGALEQGAASLRELLLDALAELEAAVDFHDDSVGQRRIDEALEVARSAVGSWMAGAVRAEALEEGFRVVLSGPPNVGKSSLFNALLASDRAIVTDEPGTTRDVLEGRIVTGDLAIVLVDTAGEREALSAAEAEGVRRSRRAREGADLVLEVREAPALAGGERPGAGRRAWVVASKIDLVEGFSRAVRTAVTDRAGDARVDSGVVHAVSARTGEGVDELLQALAVEARGASGGDGPLLLQARQRDVARRMDAALAAAVAARAQGLSEEYVAEFVREGLAALAELVGAADREDVYERVFGRFCVGK